MKMSLFGRKTPEPVAPVPDPRVATLEKSVSDLAGTVNTFVQAQAKPQAPPPADDEMFANSSMPQQAELPPISDVTDDEYEEALEEGGARARKAAQIRGRADHERIRRETDQKLAAVTAQGTRAINATTVKLALQDAPHYHTNAAIKTDVDRNVKQLASQGILLDQNAIQWLYKKAVGDHAETLMDTAREEAVRKLREPEELTARGGGGRGVTAPRGSTSASSDGGVPQPEDLTSDANALLATRNRGRGIDKDEFARGLAPHRYYDYEQKKYINRKYASWDDYMEKYQEAQDEAVVQHDRYFGR